MKSKDLRGRGGFISQQFNKCPHFLEKNEDERLKLSESLSFNEFDFKLFRLFAYENQKKNIGILVE
ncbi:hypothetical protein J7E50_24770 [Pedobacter sp. ISL-68]|uniref:hypothetical protein n=1 Tax=unclassified Pedobacter TaxID=2628915 RepID=UPI001BED0A0D|nr:MULTISPECIES: hypothetical protein [unclassified Pedobacter]MBT2563120.1 hypothetical protein [Pedobacter sp. ISL-64]MBT2593458.1 hypothetical protein [Pedobacter sp. ISL-68]